MLNLLPFKQSDSSRCAPAAIKSVLYYYGIDATEDEICIRCKWSYELGCRDIDMKKAIESYGLGCSIKNNSNLMDIQYWIRHHIPVIVDWFCPGFNQSESEMPDGHSSVVVGIDAHKIHLIDPEIGRIRSINRDEFSKVWFDWKNTPNIEKWQNMTIRQIIIAYPNKLKWKSS